MQQLHEMTSDSTLGNHVLHHYDSMGFVFVLWWLYQSI